MAASDATHFPMKNQAYRLMVVFRDADGMLITSWTGKASFVSIDGAAHVSSTAPVEIGTSGQGYIDLSASEMNGSHILVKCTVTNVGAGEFTAEIKPLQSEGTGNALADTVVRFEKVIWNVYQYLINRSTHARGTGRLEVYKTDGTTVAMSANYSNDSSNASRTELS